MPITTIKGKVVEAKYYPASKSIAVVLEDVETKKRSKPLQLHYTALAVWRPDQDVDDEMLKTAALFRQFKWPITLRFDPSTGEASM